MPTWIIKKRKAKEFFATADFSSPQMEDETIVKVIQLKREGIALTTSEKSEQFKDVWMLMRDMEKLILSDNSVLYRYTTESNSWFSRKN